jgi:hypothetical protein
MVSLVYLCAAPLTAIQSQCRQALRSRQGARNDIADACVRTATNEQWRVNGPLVQAQLEFLGLLNSVA